MIVVCTPENVMFNRTSEAVELVISTDFGSGTETDCIQLADLEPPPFLKVLAADNHESAMYFTQVFEKIYNEYLNANNAAFFILKEFLRHYEQINLVCINKITNFDYCSFIIHTLKDKKFDVRLGED